MKGLLIFFSLVGLILLGYWQKDRFFKATPWAVQENSHLISYAKEGPHLGSPLIGGAFDLVDQDGKRRTHKDFRGRWLLVYFGYAFCPDICPMALENISEALKRLGPQAKLLQVLFVTVDPGRDTQATLKKFLQNYDSRIIGLTGTAQAVRDAMASYRVHAAKVEGAVPDYYMMDHTSLVYIMSPRGQYIQAFNHATSPEEIVKVLKDLL